MKLLNIAAGGVRPQDEFWWNLDRLREVFPIGTPERTNLDAEPRYVEHSVGSAPLPFEDNSFSGCLISHFLEHMDCMDGLRLMEDCLRILEPGGILIVSVPDAEYFLKVYDDDNVENAMRLFGEEIHLPDGEVTFFRYALWMREHRAIFSESTLWCYFRRAGFVETFRVGREEDHWMIDPKYIEEFGSQAMQAMLPHLNRLPFSLVMAGVKE